MEKNDILKEKSLVELIQDPSAEEEIDVEDPSAEEDIDFDDTLEIVMNIDLDAILAA